MTRICYALIFAFLTACSPRSEETTHSFRIFEEDGIPIAANRGGPRYGEELFDYELMLVLQEDGREESILHNPTSFLLDEEDRCYVCDTGNRRIAVFDPRGRYERAIGREGSGPGEFRRLRLLDLQDGVLTVYDASLDRITRIRTDGTVIDVSRRPGSLRSGVLTGYWVLPGDHILVSELYTGILGQELPESVTTRATLIGTAGDTIWTISISPVRSLKRITVHYPHTQSVTRMPIAFAPMSDMDYRAEFGLAVSNGIDPEIRFLDGDGLLQRSVRLELPLEQPTVEERQCLRRRLLDDYEREEDEYTKAIDRAYLEGLEFPKEKPHWTEIVLDESGHLWLQLPMAGVVSTGDTTAVFRVVSADGEYLGLTTAPRGSGHHPSQGHMLLQRTDPDSGFVELCIYAIWPRVRGLRYP